jgi:predicted kinase
LKENHIVYLLVGPRAAGKTTWASAALKEKPDLLLISRDAILVELFGSEHTDPYSGAGQYVMQTLFDRLREKLTEGTASTIVLDCWTGSSDERQPLVRKLRSYGAVKVIALLFTTPLACVEQWFWKKPGIGRLKDIRNPGGYKLAFFGEDAPRNDFQLFHELITTIHDDGFDQVIQINPLETPRVFPWAPS